MQLKVVFVVVLLILCPLLSLGARYRCYTGTIPGCTCTATYIDYTYKTTLSCNAGVGSVNDLSNTILKTSGYQFDDVIFSAYPNSRFPAKMFDETTVIKRLIIKDSPLLEGFGTNGAAPTGVFTNLGKSLETIVLDNLPKLRDVEYENIGKQLSPTKIKALDDVTETPSDKGSLEAFSENTFKHFLKADFVDLSGNPLSCDCSRLPNNFESEENKILFQGSICSTPASIKGLQYGSTCMHVAYLFGDHYKVEYLERYSV
ncbi:unnamed protein product [Medioppia subpectinata]|uniref:Uncharacterized protein n=1 Tax=Medioppia subpectinata TaxID=1979941 RepID=A0A7R9L5Y3_9ACAR|nr:unnamed protein product [Medioppia subpectinata]CAG2114927.1 unnamed protein product [Medioppia subpectinata]